MPPKRSNTKIVKKPVEKKEEMKEEIKEEIKEEKPVEKKEDNKEKLYTNLGYYPIVSEVQDIKNSIFDTNPDPKYSLNNIDYPSFQLGFQHFIHASKNKMVILKEYENKKKVHLVLNPFERYVDNYDDNIGNMTKKYFDITGDKPDVLSRGFYKLWELLLMFNLIDKDNTKFVSAHLAEGPGSFIQATMFYREMFCKDYKNDKYHAVTLHPEDTKNHVPEMEKDFIKYYDKEKNKRFILHKTYNKQTAGGSRDKHNGDITDPKTINLFGGQMDDRADFITADGGFNWKNENTQEQEAFKLIFGQIYGALKIQKKGGNFVCKVFETFTKVSMKMITILREFYDKVYVCKPLMSRPSNSEKYLVCMGFKYGEKDSEYKNRLKMLEIILEESHNAKTMNLIDIFPNYNIEPHLIKLFIQINVKIANIQFKAINEILDFLNKQNFYGDVYQLSRQHQVEANKYWISTYYPVKSKLQETEKKLKNIIEKQLIS